MTAGYTIRSLLLTTDGDTAAVRAIVSAVVAVSPGRA